MLDPTPAYRDNVLWEHVLQAVRDDLGPFSLFGALYTIRLLGARLVASQGVVRLEPGAYLKPTWEEDREKWLVPHRDRLQGVLESLSSVL